MGLCAKELCRCTPSRYTINDQMNRVMLKYEKCGTVRMMEIGNYAEGVCVLSSRIWFKYSSLKYQRECKDLSRNYTFIVMRFLPIRHSSDG